MEVDLPVNRLGNHVPDGVMLTTVECGCRPQHPHGLRAEPRLATPPGPAPRPWATTSSSLPQQHWLQGSRRHARGRCGQGREPGADASDGARIGRQQQLHRGHGRDPHVHLVPQHRRGVPNQRLRIGSPDSVFDDGQMRTPPATACTAGLSSSPWVTAGTSPPPGATCSALRRTRKTPRPRRTGFSPTRAGPRAWDDYRNLAMLFMDEPEGSGRTARGRHPGSDKQGVTDVSFGFKDSPHRARSEAIPRAINKHRDGKVVTLPDRTMRSSRRSHWCNR